MTDGERPLRVRRHEAHVHPLPQGRTPYRVESEAEGRVVASDEFTLAPAPPHGAGARILLTSDHQLAANVGTCMELAARTLGPVDAVVAVPGSKSIANRALVCAALADGTSELRNVPPGDDTVAMLTCLRRLGIDIDATINDAVHGAVNDEIEDAVDVIDVIDVVDGRLAVTGRGGALNAPDGALHAGLAGTTSRFVTALAALAGAPVTIDGDPPLRSRPFLPLHEALTQLGVTVTAADRPGHLPVTVEGPPTGGAVAIRGDISSQFVTALMLIGPCLPDGLTLQLTSPLVSRPYVELTASVMSWFGAGGVTVGDDSIMVAPGRYRQSEVTIEPDASSASYPMAVAAVAGGSVEVPGLGARSLQGDARFVALLSAMGCEVEDSGTGMWVGRAHHQPLVGIDVDMSEISDLVPTMAVVAAFATTPTWIRGVGFIRNKESDRLGDLARELSKAGIDVEETTDGLVVRPSRPHAATLATHHDHRLAMAFGVLGAAVDGIVVEEPDVVTKSWPGFWDVLDALDRQPA